MQELRRSKGDQLALVGPYKDSKFSALPHDYLVKVAKRDPGDSQMKSYAKAYVALHEVGMNVAPSEGAAGQASPEPATHLEPCQPLKKTVASRWVMFTGGVRRGLALVHHSGRWIKAGWIFFVLIILTRPSVAMQLARLVAVLGGIIFHRISRFFYFFWWQLWSEAEQGMANLLTESGASPLLSPHPHHTSRTSAGQTCGACQGYSSWAVYILSALGAAFGAGITMMAMAARAMMQHLLVQAPAVAPALN